MNTRDNIQAELQVLRMENVRLTNELVKRNDYASFLEDENKKVEEETRQEYEDKISLMEMERDNAFAKAKEAEKEIQTANLRADKEKMRADNAEQMLGEARKALEESNPVMPSFARFYLESKFCYNLSENRILEMLKGMKTNIPQSSLDLWMHQIMEMLSERLEPLMLEAIRQSKFTNNDATRLLVRSRETPDDPLKYTIKNVQAVLSLEKKLCVMFYDKGTRDHMLQEEKIFKVSSIVGFVADRAPQYPAIVKDFEGQELLCQASWFHARHYLVDAYLVDSRMEMLLILINVLFYIERVFLQEDDQSPEHRLEFRKEWSEPIVDRIMEMLKKMRAAGDKYGQMVHRTVDYILDDEDVFRTFLSDGRIDIHNIAINLLLITQFRN